MAGGSSEEEHAAGQNKDWEVKLAAVDLGLVAMAMKMERGWGWASLTRAREVAMPSGLPPPSLCLSMGSSAAGAC